MAVRSSGAPTHQKAHQSGQEEPAADGRPQGATRRQPGWKPGPRAVGAYVPKLTQKAFEKYGFAAASIVTDWPAIVGREFAGYTRPERLNWPRRRGGEAEVEAGSRGQSRQTSSKRPQSSRPGAVLLLRCDGPRAIEVQHRARQIIERINAYFGYLAVTEIRILQAPVASTRLDTPRPTHPAHPLPPRLARPSASPLAAMGAIEDPDLRGALERLAAGLSLVGRAAVTA